MSPRFFSKSEAVLFGWNALKKNSRFFIGLLAIMIALNILFSLIMFSFSEEAPQALVMAAGIVFVIFETLIGMGIIKICLKFCDQEPARYGELFSAYPLLLNYIAGSIIYGIMVTTGLLFLVVPGLYLALKHQFYSYSIIDQRKGPLQAIKMSGVLTEGVKWNLALFWLMLAGINILGMLALGVGLAVTIPLSWLATAYVYRRLQMQAQNAGAIPLKGLD